MRPILEKGLDYKNKNLEKLTKDYGKITIITAEELYLIQMEMSILVSLKTVKNMDLVFLKISKEVNTSDFGKII